VQGNDAPNIENTVRDDNFFATYFFLLCLLQQTEQLLKEKFMQEAIIVAIVFGSAIYVIKLVSDNRIRRRIIESGQLDEKIKFLNFEAEKTDPVFFSSVKWGLVLIALGLGLLMGQFFPYRFNEEMTFAFMFLFAGIAFIIYYFLAKKRASDQLE
jgi:hypothetical protein